MTPHTRNKACDAFNLLVFHGKLSKDYLYGIVEDQVDRRTGRTVRQEVEKAWSDAGFHPVGYSPFREYVFLWKEPNGEKVYAEAKLIAVGDFIASASGLTNPKGRGMMG